MASLQLLPKRTAMHWKEAAIHFVDFEGSLSSGIVEFGVATLRGGEVVSLETRLCATAGELRREETLRHKITRQMTANAAPFSAEWELFSQLRMAGVLAAHFCGTENALLCAVWPYTRLSPDFSQGATQAAVNTWGPWIDTGQLARRLFRGPETARLEDLVEAFGIGAVLQVEAEKYCPAERCHFHAAGYDALAGALLLRAMLQQAAYAEATITWLIEKSAAQSSSAGQQELF